jgi:hypothetical protein
MPARLQEALLIQISRQAYAAGNSSTELHDRLIDCQAIARFRHDFGNDAVVFGLQIVLKSRGSTSSSRSSHPIDRRRLRGARRASMARDTLATWLIDLYDQTSTSDWRCFEPMLTYDNARLPQALIVSGQESGNSSAVAIGLSALRWLTGLQKARKGHFRGIGSNGFYARGQRRAQFDQQPLEASATVSACLSAYELATTRPGSWKHRRRSSGSSGETTSVSPCTTRPQVGVATGSIPIEQTRTRALSRPWRSSWHLPR